MISKSDFKFPDVVYEDEEVVVLNKPSGLVMHGDGKTKEKTLADFIVERYPNLIQVGEEWIHEDQKIIRPGIVHRLDRETSGVVIIAKTKESYGHLKTQFQERLIEKKYAAFVYGVLKEKKGTIDLPIGKNKKDFRQKSAEKGARGVLRDAVTEYEVLKEGEGASYLLLTPKTGRTHQLRVHLKAIQHPIVCDALYAPNREPVLGLKRLALHARSLSLKLPNGIRMTFETPLPGDFEEALRLLTNTK